MGKLGESVKDEVDQRGSEAQLRRGKKFWGAMVHSGRLWLQMLHFYFKRPQGRIWDFFIIIDNHLRSKLIEHDMVYASYKKISWYNMYSSSVFMELCVSYK